MHFRNKVHTVLYSNKLVWIKVIHRSLRKLVLFSSFNLESVLLQNRRQFNTIVLLYYNFREIQLINLSRSSQRTSSRSTERCLAMMQHRRSAWSARVCPPSGPRIRERALGADACDVAERPLGASGRRAALRLVRVELEVMRQEVAALGALAAALQLHNEVLPRDAVAVECVVAEEELPAAIDLRVRE